MKKLFVMGVILGIFIFSNACAQFGIEAGLNYTSGHLESDEADMSETGSGTGFHFGAYYNYPLQGSNFLKLGFGICTRNVEFSYSEGGWTYKMAPEITSFDFPVLYSIPSKSNSKMTFLVGATVVMENDGNVKLSYSGYGESGSETDSIDDEDLETDIYLTGGIRYHLQGNIYPEVKLQFNMTPDRDVYGSDAENSKNFSILLSCGLDF